jgi:hypothetical protein
MGRFVEMSGMKFGRLTVVSRAGSVAYRRVATWRCRCDCGVETIVEGRSLRSGHTKSCGCYAIETRKKNGKKSGGNQRTTHGHCVGYRFSPTYGTWAAMRKRCENESHDRYKYYGGRGIRVCDRWKSFENFLADMGPKPTPQHSIDRFPDNDGNYEPGNCRWATSSEQARNQRRSSRRRVEEVRA